MNKFETDLQREIEPHLNRIVRILQGKYKLTLVARYAGSDFSDADILLTLDDLAEAIKVIDRFRTRDREKSGVHYESPVHIWFELSYASFLTIPRVLMEAMPYEWQEKMVVLLEEYEAAFPNQPDIGTRVQITRDGKLIKTPEWLINYRHPDRGMIESLRAGAEQKT